MRFGCVACWIVGSWALHACVPLEASIALSTRWKPQRIGAEVVSLTGVRNYVTARIQLMSNVSGTAGILDDQFNLFVVVTDGPNVSVKAVLWSHHTARIEAFSNLRQWHSWHFSNGVIVGDFLGIPEDRALWYASDT